MGLNFLGLHDDVISLKVEKYLLIYKPEVHMV